MKPKLNIALFCHSLVSDWNHGNVHFLRGLMRELVKLGHRVKCYEELGSWSLANLIENEGERAIQAIDNFRQTYPELDIRFYQFNVGLQPFLEQELQGADIVLLHEWNDPIVANSVLALKKKYGFITLLHDTHHRAYTRAGEILKFHLHLLDGVLAFGEAIRRIYLDGFGVGRAWTFHEAAEITEFKPLSRDKEIDLIWIGNWGDDERSGELREFLLASAAGFRGARCVAYGVRYPESVRSELHAAGIDYRGYLPNLSSPEAYARSMVTLHVPRRSYSNGLTGIPTIRMFEALACGIPLVCSPWTDTENLFRRGEDYVVVEDSDQMKAELKFLLGDERARRQMAENGIKTIHERHTCAHRANELISICEEIAG